MSSDAFEFIKRRTLVALLSSEQLRELLVLKGGNLISAVFQVGSRASIDLDFSIEGEFNDAGRIRTECESVLRRTFAVDGFRVIDVTCQELPRDLSGDLKDFWGGYRIGFKLVLEDKFVKLANDVSALRRNAVPLRPNGSTVFTIDVSKYEYCGEKQRFDIDGQVGYGYSPEMVIAEKLRAVCQQMPEYRSLVRKNLAGRARDFVDIVAIREAYLINFENQQFRDTVARVFAAKRVPLYLLGRISECRDDHRQDFILVRSTVKAIDELADFDFYVDYVVREVSRLETLWNE